MSAPRKGFLPWARAILALLVCSMLAAGVLVLLGLDVHRYVVGRRGVESGLSSDLPPLETPRLGVNVSLEQY
ncbi:MAG: hypothetical protein U9R48_02770, partial [Chloroflexota bacterium]|nr:hypothetical protein [Chloroflexota bacterium]